MYMLNLDSRCNRLVELGAELQALPAIVTFSQTFDLVNMADLSLTPTVHVNVIHVTEIECS